MQRELTYMREAIELSKKGLTGTEGGPFGCVIVKDDKVIGRGWNRVTSMCDPTAHAEVVAIRDACAKLGSFQLTGCEVYTSCEPCPMCMGALYWARPEKVFFANTREDAAAIGFDDSMIYEELKFSPEARRLSMENIGAPEAIEVFKDWHAMEERKRY
ncbi:MAG: nucleoside deaminase [Chitinophagaceae bacterium]